MKKNTGHIFSIIAAIVQLDNYQKRLNFCVVYLRESPDIPSGFASFVRLLSAFLRGWYNTFPPHIFKITSPGGQVD
ncbi:MAG TPA: hypothetical protein DDX85_09165 [Nitrospiraceae bacterium]|nr:hypothetical protein [Nitrospiraceae bacterium]